MQIKLVDSEYFALDRLSFSSIKHLLKSPQKYLYEKQNPFKGNDASNLGTAIHLKLQGQEHLIAYEPNLQGLKTKAGVIAKEPRMTTEGIQILKDFRQGLSTEIVVVLPWDAEEKLERIKSGIETNPEIKDIMTKVSNTEAAYLTTIQGLPFKGKLDEEGIDFIVDYKSVGKPADKYSFKRVILDSHYDLQAAIYLTMKADTQKIPIDSIEYYIFAIETFPPYEIYPYLLSKETRERGFQKLESVISSYRKLEINKLEKIIPFNSIESL